MIRSWRLWFLGRRRRSGWRAYNRSWRSLRGGIMRWEIRRWMDGEWWGEVLGILLRSITHNRKPIPLLLLLLTFPNLPPLFLPPPPNSPTCANSSPLWPPNSSTKSPPFYPSTNNSSNFNESSWSNATTTKSNRFENKREDNRIGRRISRWRGWGRRIRGWRRSCCWRIGVGHGSNRGSNHNGGMERENHSNRVRRGESQNILRGVISRRYSNSLKSFLKRQRRLPISELQLTSNETNGLPSSPG